MVGRYIESLGYPVLDTDEVVRALYASDPLLKEGLSQAFGPQIIGADGAVDRKALRDIVFNDSQKLQQLESMVHPRVREKTLAFLEDKSLPTPLRFTLVPLLFEAGTEKHYDEVWAVVVEPEVLVERLMARDQISQTEAEKRLSKQWPQADKARKAHRVIDNSGAPDTAKATVKHYIETLLERLHRETF